MLVYRYRRVDRPVRLPQANWSTTARGLAQLSEAVHVASCSIRFNTFGAGTIIAFITQLIRDRDGVYGGAVTRRLRAMSICDKPIAHGSPWQNGFAERLIGLIRRERTDSIAALGEGHLRRVLRSYAS